MGGSCWSLGKAPEGEKAGTLTNTDQPFVDRVDVQAAPVPKIKKASKPASERASEQASKQASKREGRGLIVGVVGGWICLEAKNYKATNPQRKPPIESTSTLSF